MTRARAAQVAAPAGQLLIVTSEIVRTEWLRNAQVLQEVERHVRKVQADNDRIAACGNHLGRGVPALALPGLGIPAALHALAEDMLDDALEIPMTPAINLRAFQRDVAARGPARRGKDNVGDCVVAETLLEFADATQGARGALGFLTYNIHDFTNGAGPVPHNDLAPDFARLGIQFGTHWNWAAHALGF